jgi:hypothetical protein
MRKGRFSEEQMAAIIGSEKLAMGKFLSAAIAVANIEAALVAILPDRVLDEPGKGLRKRWIELPGIDPLGNALNNVGAAAQPVAGRAIQVVRVEPGQDASAVQKVVTQGVDGDHAAGHAIQQGDIALEERRQPVC